MAPHFCFITLIPLVIFDTIVRALPPPTPTDGLGGNSNYFYYSSGETINSLQATVEFDTDLIGDPQDDLSLTIIPP
jgi:hypothetical protein